MKKSVLQPILSDENVIVQYTDNIVADKSTAITVPDGFQGIVFIDERVLFRISPCVEKPLLDYGKELKGKLCRVAFVRTKAIPAMAWGFGNIQVNNARLKEAYRAGANGKYVVEIVSVPKLIAHFDSDRDITLEKLRDCTISVIKNIGTAYVAEYFAGTNISVFEISAHTAELRERLFAALKDEDVFASLGLKLKDLTVDGIHINEDDLALIRAGINGDTSKKEDVQPDAGNAVSDEMLERLEEELSELRAALDEKQSAAEPDLADKLKDLRDELVSEISSQIGDKMQDMQSAIAENIEEKFLEFMPLKDRAREDYLKNLKITAEECIERAKDEDDLVPAAAIVYSVVEKNLIRKFGLRHENKNFVMDYAEYIDLADRLSKPNGEFLLKRYNRESRRYILIPPAVIKSSKDGKPEVVEMPPVIRFYKAGMSVADALRAREYWSFLNKIRHQAPENERYLHDKFANFAQKKGYLVSALEFFRAHGLYADDEEEL